MNPKNVTLIEHWAPPTCGTCRSRKKELKTCGRCRVVKYCSKSCQTKDFKGHKHVCKVISHYADVAEKVETKVQRAAKILDGCPEFFQNYYKFPVGLGFPAVSFMADDFFKNLRKLVEAKGFCALEILRTAEEYQDKAQYELACSELLEVLGLAPGGKAGINVRNLVPCILLTLGRVDDCYNMIKWYVVKINDEDYDWVNAAARFVRCMENGIIIISSQFGFAL